MNEVLTIYVPKGESPWAMRIARGSGIVGKIDERTGRLLIHYEGNIYGAENLRTYGDRVHQAAGRLRVNYPTVATALVDPAHFKAIGRLDGNDITIDDVETLDAWLL